MTKKLEWLPNLLNKVPLPNQCIRSVHLQFLSFHKAAFLEPQIPVVFLSQSVCCCSARLQGHCHYIRPLSRPYQRASENAHVCCVYFCPQCSVTRWDSAADVSACQCSVMEAVG